MLAVTATRLTRMLSLFDGNRTSNMLCSCSFSSIVSCHLRSLHRFCNHGDACISSGRNTRGHATLAQGHALANKSQQSSSPLSQPLPIQTESSNINTLFLPLDDGLSSLVDHVSYRRHIKDRQVRVAIIVPPSQTLVHLISTAFRQEKVAMAVLPVDFSLLVSRLPKEPVSSFKKHVEDNWRSLMVEAGADVVLTTGDYFPLVGPICHELTLPLYVVTDRPTILSAQDYEAAIKAGHGFVDLLNVPAVVEGSGPQQLPLPSLTTESNAVDKLYVFSEIGSCNGKSAIHTPSTLQAAFKSISTLLKLGRTDNVMNCLFPHEYAYTVYGVLYPLSVQAAIHCPLRVVPSTSYTKLKLEFPLTCIQQRNSSMHETVTLTLAKSVFDYVRSSNCKHTMLMCNSQTFRMLLAFITCDGLSQSEKSAYLRGLQHVKRMLVFEDASRLFDGHLADEAAAFMEATSLAASVTQVYTLPEVGAVAYMALDSTTPRLIKLPGCDIIDNGEEFTVSARTDSLFTEYFKKARATAEALSEGEGCLRLTFRKPIEATRLLDNHADYVTYFKRRRERMARYPQGYVKKVPVRTQFWGNFTGKHKHHSVL